MTDLEKDIPVMRDPLLKGGRTAIRVVIPDNTLDRFNMN